jgi:hypothetical protein
MDTKTKPPPLTADEKGIVISKFFIQLGKLAGIKASFSMTEPPLFWPRLRCGEGGGDNSTLLRINSTS